MPGDPLSSASSATLRRAARSRTPELLRRVRAYVEHETPTGDRAALDAFAERLVRRYGELGCTARRVAAPHGDHVAADHPGHPDRAGEKPLLFIGHHDTVWPHGHVTGPMPWQHDEDPGEYSGDGPDGPGTVADAGEVARGPGVFDMKSGLVVMEAALALAAEAGLAHRPVRIVVVADEEVGSPTSTDLVRDRAEGACAALGFESPHPGGALKQGRRGSTRLRLHAAGRAAHAALDPDQGVSAIDELVDALVAVRGIAERHAPGLLCNVGTLTGGGRTNVVADAASADIGLRFSDAATERAVLDALSELRPIRPGAELRTETLSSRPTWAVDGGEDLLTRAVAATADRLGLPFDAAPAAGAADTNTVGALGLPALDGLGPDGAGAHALHERILVPSLPDRAALVTALLAEL